jgi:hypothetical protein
MFGHSTSHMLMEFDISKAVNEILDHDIIGQCSMSNNSDFDDDDYTQLVIPGTHTISDSGSINDGERQRTMMHDEQGVQMGGVSMKFVKARYQHIICSTGNILWYPRPTV